MKAQATISVSVELIPKISDVGKELNISSNKAMALLVQIGLEAYSKMTEDEKLRLGEL